MDMHTQQEKASILLIYTGGTIGMIEILVWMKR